MTRQFPALEAKKAELKKILDEAGPEMDVNRIKSISGSAQDKVAHIRRLSAELDDLKALSKTAEGSYIGESGDGARTDVASYMGGSRGLKGAQVLRKGQRLTDRTSANGYGHASEGLSFGNALKGIVTGDWRGAEAERKAMSEGTLSAGGHVVPTPLASSLIDLVRNKSVVMQAGATLVPMTTQTLKIPRLTGEGTPGWRNENAAITDADLAFDAVTFTARSLARLVKLSRELFEDSSPAAGSIIEHSFAAQLALELDRVALRGTGTAPEPRGVLNQSGVTITTHGANGANITNYDFHLDAVGAVRNNNLEPNAQVQAPRTATSLSKLKEATTNAYLAPPAGLADIVRFNTKQVPVNLTVGTSTDCSEIYTGQWDMLGIGIRTGIEIEFLKERYADNLQIGVLAHLRADIQVFHPESFVVDTGVRA